MKYESIMIDHEFLSGFSILFSILII